MSPNCSLRLTGKKCFTFFLLRKPTKMYCIFFFRRYVLFLDGECFVLLLFFFYWKVDFNHLNIIKQKTLIQHKLRFLIKIHFIIKCEETNTYEISFIMNECKPVSNVPSFNKTNIGITLINSIVIT